MILAIIEAICIVVAAFALIINYKEVLRINKIEAKTRYDIIELPQSNTTEKAKDEIRNTRFANMLAQAGVSDSPMEYIVKVGGTLIAGAILGILFLGLVSLPVIVLLILGGKALSLSFRKKKRAALFDVQLAATLPTIAQLLRAGRTLEHAIAGVVSICDNPLKDEFLKASKEIAFDNDTSTAFNRMAERTGSKDMVLLSCAVEINAKQGGNFADTVDVIAETIRSRQALKRMISSETASTKASAFAIIIVQLIIVVALIAGNGEIYGSFYLDTPQGMIVLGGLVLYELIGLLIMLRVVKLEFD